MLIKSKYIDYTMEKLSMCRICLVQNVRMCVVTNKSLQEMYEKLTDVPFVTEDSKPMLACFICCTRLKQCCQLQRKCVEAEELLAQMLSEDYEPLTNQGHLEFVGRFIITPIENISIVDDCQIESDAIKQELPAVCEEQDDVELQPAHLREELDPENLYHSHPDIEAHHFESDLEEDQCVMEIKIEGEEEQELSENLRVKETEKLELENLDKYNPDVEDIPALDAESDSEDYVPLIKIKTEVEEGLEEPKRKQRPCVTKRAAVPKKPTLKRKLEGKISGKQTMNFFTDSKIIRTIETSTPESVTKLKEPLTTISQTSLSKSSNLIQHTQMHTGEKPFKCDICQRSFGDKSKLNTHFRIHTGEKPFKCDVCQRSFSQKSSLIIHSRQHTGEKPYQCDVCQRSFICKSKLNLHLRKHSGENLFKCDLCRFTKYFAQSTNLKQHIIRFHTDEKLYKCDVCQRSFSSTSNLNAHSRTHTGEKPYKCDVCQHSFTNKSTLIYHTQTHTGEKPYKCNICWRNYSNRSYLDKHIRIHTGEKPFKCDVCQRSFSFKSNLEVHFRKHSGENPFKCHICHRTFAQSSNLKQHIRVHTGEKPYKCDVCQRSFNFKNNLAEHFRKHSGENPFKCDVCQRSFGQSSHLKQHIRVHTGEKPYKCDVCQRSFGQSSHLKQHIRVHSGDKPC